jgi:tetratricopeptide (TPR) repeat protein
MLHDEDAETAGLAEHALWSIWFRAGTPQANLCLTRAIRLISEGHLDRGIRLLDAIIEEHPDFAEAYNQRAIAKFLQGEYEQVVADCEETLRLNPHHFGASAGLGHSYAARGLLDLALGAYRRTLGIHPRLEGIRQSMQQIRKCMARARAADAASPSSPSQAP